MNKKGTLYLYISLIGDNIFCKNTNFKIHVYLLITFSFKNQTQVLS